MIYLLNLSYDSNYQLQLDMHFICEFFLIAIMYDETYVTIVITTNNHTIIITMYNLVFSSQII